MGRTRTDDFGILAIVIAIVSGVWLFGFADDVFSAFEIEFDELENVPIYKYAENPKETQSIDDMVQENIAPESLQPVPNEPVSLEAKEKTVTLEPITTTPKEPIIKAEQNTVESLSNKIKRIEQQTFTLSGYGSGYEVDSNLSEYSKMDLFLNPVLGTELEEFSIRRGTLNVGGHTFVIGGGQVILESNVISINIEHDDQRDPYLNMIGTVNGSILDDKTLFVTFENQLLGLTKNDQTPIHLSLELKMEIKN